MSEPFISEIKIVSFNFPPRGWALCNGQLLPINQNQALFSLLGTTYGGDGRVNFALPELRGRVPIHVSSGHALGQTGGAENHRLTLAEMPAHTHVPGLPATSADADLKLPADSRYAHSAVETYALPGPLAPLAAGTTNPAGGGQPHINLQPYLVLNFIIALQGIFPSPT